MKEKTSSGACVLERIVEMNDREYGMRFDMLALSFAEEVYKQRYGRAANAAVIMGDALDVRMSGVLALGYGAMRSYGEKMSFERFCREVCTYDTFETLVEPLTAGILEMLGDEHEQAGDAPKN